MSFQQSIKGAAGNFGVVCIQNHSAAGFNNYRRIIEK